MSLETQGIRPEEDRECEIFFLSRVLCVHMLRRKPALEKVFGFGEVRRVGPKVFREVAKFGAVSERTYVHKAMGDQKIRPWAGVARNLATCGHDQNGHRGAGLDCGGGCGL
jgi:hypothetical protein